MWAISNFKKFFVGNLFDKDLYKIMYFDSFYNLVYKILV